MFSTFSTEFGSTTPWNRRDQKAVGYEDIPNNLVISYIYDLPFGQGKKFLSNQKGVVNQLVGGWKYSGILTYQGGLPINIESCPSDIPGGLEDQGCGNVSQVPGVPLRSHGRKDFDPSVDRLMNPAAFEVPPEWTFGTLTPDMDHLRQFPYMNEDMSLMKEWTFNLIHDEPFTLRFNADFFNVFNRTIFNQDGDNGAYAMEPTLPSSTFGELGGQTNIPREVQFGLRLKW